MSMYGQIKNDFYFRRTDSGRQELVRADGTSIVCTNKNEIFEKLGGQAFDGWQRAMLLIQELDIWDGTGFGCTMNTLAVIKYDGFALLFASCEKAEQEIYDILPDDVTEQCRKNVEDFYANPELQKRWINIILHPVCLKYVNGSGRFLPFSFDEIERLKPLSRKSGIEPIWIDTDLIKFEEELFGESALYEKKLEEMRRTRKTAAKDDFTCNPMPECHVELSIERELSDIDKEVLGYGNIPTEMEDKWFWYVEDGILYAHRSWTGNCIYMIELSSEHEQSDERIRVMINHDMTQNPWTVLDDAVEELQILLNWWTQPEYDYYGEWLDETARAAEKQASDAPDDEQDDETLVIERAHYRAFAEKRGGEFVVLKGSTINPNITGVMPAKAAQMRENGLAEGFIGEDFEITEDVVFGSSSAAAAFVVGHTVSGPKTWKNVSLHNT